MSQKYLFSKECAIAQHSHQIIHISMDRTCAEDDRLREVRGDRMGEHSVEGDRLL